VLEELARNQFKINDFLANLAACVQGRRHEFECGRAYSVSRKSVEKCDGGRRWRVKEQEEEGEL